MPTGLPCWRNADAYVTVLAGGRPALAWELLRRNPGYRADDDASRWGIHFRL